MPGSFHRPPIKHTELNPVTDDERLVAEMALAGCAGVFVGLETLATSNLVEARKQTPPAEEYARRVALFHACGIQVNGSFVLGFDHDTPDVFASTVAHPCVIFSERATVSY